MPDRGNHSPSGDAGPDATPEDFVWRFRLDEVPHDPVFDDPLLELIRVQWEELLKLCVPYDGDHPVRVDGFALMRDEERVYGIFRGDPRHQPDEDGG